MNEDIHQETLAEVRKIRRAIYIFLIVFLCGALPTFFASFSRELANRSTERTAAKQSEASWEQVTTAVDRQDFKKALFLAQTLVYQQPNYSYGQAYLGQIYCAMGDLTNAESHYLRAYELFPNAQGETDLQAVRKRLEKQRQ